MSDAPARKPIHFGADEHARWKAAADAAGEPLAEYVRRAVEARRAGGLTMVDAPTAAARSTHRRPTPTVDPKVCVNRLRAGAWCRECGAIHR